MMLVHLNDVLVHLNDLLPTHLPPDQKRYRPRHQSTVMDSMLFNVWARAPFARRFSLLGAEIEETGG